MFILIIFMSYSQDLLCSAPPANVSGVTALLTVILAVLGPCDVHDVFIHHSLYTVPKTHRKTHVYQVGLLREDLTTTFDQKEMSEMYLQDVLELCVHFRTHLL